MSPVRIVMRADDSGSCLSANSACLRAAREGVIRNLSVMVPGPAFDSLAPELKGLEHVAIGLHVVLNAEWERVKWGPVLGSDRVPTLCDGGKAFTPTPMHLHEQGFSLDEAEAEVRAQLKRGQDLGVTFHYMDEHMGVGWLPGLRDRLQSIARDEGLLYPAELPALPAPTVPFNEFAVDAFLAVVRQAAPGTYLAVYHPGLDAPDMQAFGHQGLGLGQVARERAAETTFLTHPDLLRAVEEGVFQPIRYTDL